MIFDWLAREGIYFITWWLLIAAAGAAAFPLCYRLLGGLADRGYTLARAVGILLTAFVFWFASSLGLLPNTPGAMLLAWLAVLGISLTAVATMPERVPLREYWRENRPVIVAGEVLFAVLLLGWMIVRAQYPDTWSTEKPMDLMFISSIMHSPTFPPSDGWMAGYSISYYYFGYVMSAMLSTLSQVSSTVGFSMTLASWFALTGLSAFGVTYNLVRSRSRGDHADHVLQSYQAPLATGLLAVFFVLIMSNWQFPVIELPWQTSQADASYYDFWATQDRMGDSSRPQAAEFHTLERWDNWWWFRASRVLNDVQLDGSAPPEWYAQPIDEFPSFSFLLGDAHPHVLALPFGLMALGLALNVLLARRNPSLYDLTFYGITIGALVFLNTWDILAYGSVFLGADALRRMFRNENGRLSWTDIAGLVGDAVVFGVVTLLAYGLFLISFRSQAAGITVNVSFPTYFPHLILMFGPFLLLISAYLLLEMARGRRRMNWRVGFGTAGVVMLVIASVVAVGLIVLALRPDLKNLSRDFIDQAGGLSVVLPQLLVRRLTYLPTTLLMLAFIVVIVARLFAWWQTKRDGLPVVTYSKASAFALLLIAVGAFLVIVPEFVHLVDVFSSRINTIFKFYYQVWAVWGIASAFAVYTVLADSEATRPAPVLRWALGAVLVVIIGAGSLYLMAGTITRSTVEPFYSGRGVTSYGVDVAGLVVVEGQTVARGELLAAPQGVDPIYATQAGQVRLTNNQLQVRSQYSLDGGSQMITQDDYNVLQCLTEIAQPNEIAVEAVRDAYNAAYGRVPAITGVPILLGWENHQRQWRGSTYNDIVSTRPADVETLYTDPSWELIQPILQRYGLDYILFGTTERQQYGETGRQKFIENLPIACQSGDSVLFRVPARLQ